MSYSYTHAQYHVVTLGLEMADEAHRPGPLKQQNKPHKHGKHKSKSSIDTINKGE